VGKRIGIKNTKEQERLELDIDGVVEGLLRGCMGLDNK